MKTAQESLRAIRILAVGNPTISLAQAIASAETLQGARNQKEVKTNARLALQALFQAEQVVKHA